MDFIRNFNSKQFDDCIWLVYLIYPKAFCTFEILFIWFLLFLFPLNLKLNFISSFIFFIYYPILAPIGRDHVKAAVNNFAPKKGLSRISRTTYKPQHFLEYFCMHYLYTLFIYIQRQRGDWIHWCILIFCHIKLKSYKPQYV